MKHLVSMQQTFPQMPSRNAIMGIATFDSKLPSMKGEHDSKQKGAKFMNVKVSFVVRPHLPPCGSIVVPISLTARTCDVQNIVWYKFGEEREKHGPLWGPLPSYAPTDYALHYFENNEVGARCPPNALMSRLLPNKNGGLPHVALLLKEVFIEIERLVGSEKKTRVVVESAFQDSFVALQYYERQSYQTVLDAAAQLQLFAEERLTLEQKEDMKRLVIARAAETISAKLLGDFQQKFSELEFGMVAQYNHITSLREKLAAEMEQIRQKMKKEAPVEQASVEE